MHTIECILVKSSRIFDYYNKYFITKTFDRFNYKDLVIFQLNLEKNL